MQRTLEELEKDSYLDTHGVELFGFQPDIGKPRRSGVLVFFEQLHGVRFRAELGDLAQTPVTMSVKGKSFGFILRAVLAEANCEFAVLSNGDILVKPIASGANKPSLAIE
jgi:hypothetical protein